MSVQGGSGHPRFSVGQVPDFFGGLTFSGGVPRFWGGGGEGYLVSVKGKIIDTRFGLIHVQTGKKIFWSRDPPPHR